MKDNLPNLEYVLQAGFKSLNNINCLSSKKKKSFGSSGCGRTQKLKFSGVVAHWVLHVTFVCLCLYGGVCVCESLFLIFILGVTTNHWFCIRCD